MAVIVIEDWMIEDLKLSGLELLSFALIHGCTQKGDGCWHGGYENLAKRIGATSRSSINAVNALVEKGYIAKGNGIIGGKNKGILMSNLLSYEISSHEKISHEKISPDAMKFLHPIENNNINNNNISIYSAPREIEEIPSQEENWRHLSSLRKFALGNDPDLIADYKRKLISEELQRVAPELKMPKEAQEKFLSKWCEHNPHSEKIKAEFEAVFNVRDRAEQFMGWWTSNRTSPSDSKRAKKLNPNDKWQ